MKSKVSGVVRRRFAEVGDYVKAGSALLEIRPDPTPLELVEARRQVEFRQIDVEDRASQLAQEQRASRVSSRSRLETARRDYKAALQVQTAKERLALLEGRATSRAVVGRERGALAHLGLRPGEDGGDR